MGAEVGNTVAVHVCPLCAFETSHPAVHTYPTAQSHRQGGVRLASSTQIPPNKSQPCEPSWHGCCVGAGVGASVGAVGAADVGAAEVGYLEGPVQKAHVLGQRAWSVALYCTAPQYCRFAANMEQW